MLLLLVDGFPAIRVKRMPATRLFCLFYCFYHSTHELVGVNALVVAPTMDGNLSSIEFANAANADSKINSREP